MSQATARAHANLAFVKYWGKSDHALNLPLNNSISMNLSAAYTTTTVNFAEPLRSDVVMIADDGTVSPSFAQRVSLHLDRLRALAGVTTYAQVTTENSFPAATGFASSASGFAALTVAAAGALDLSLSERELSILSRQGSGSASRSVPAGFVEWYAAETSSDSYAEQIAPPGHWDIIDIAVVVSSREKDVSSSDGHRLALNSPFWDARLAALPTTLEQTRTAILERDFTVFGHLLESEAMALHTIAMTSAHGARDGAWRSGIYYWTPDTLDLLIAVQNWRADGLTVYFTLDAGPTVHLICPARQEAVVTNAVRKLERQRPDRKWSLLVSHPAPGAHIIPLD